MLSLVFRFTLSEAKGEAEEESHGCYCKLFEKNDSWLSGLCHVYQLNQSIAYLLYF